MGKKLSKQGVAVWDNILGFFESGNLEDPNKVFEMEDQLKALPKADREKIVKVLRISLGLDSLIGDAYLAKDGSIRTKRKAKQPRGRELI